MIRTAHVLFTAILVAVCGLVLADMPQWGMGVLEASTHSSPSLSVQTMDGNRPQPDRASGVSDPDGTASYAVPSSNPDQNADGNRGGARSVHAAASNTERTLVSNTGQSADGRVLVGVQGPLTYSYAQQFTTGGHGGDYGLAGVGAALIEVESGALPKVSIFTDSSGEPGTSLYVLTKPQTIQSGSVNTFTAPNGATLTANTEYWVVFENESSGGSGSQYRVGISNSDDEDAGEASSWSIADKRRVRSRNNGPWIVHSTVLRIAIEGIVDPRAGLGSLELQDPDGDSVALVPPFDYQTYDYTAHVDNDVDEVTLTLSKIVDGATVEYMVEYLDGSGITITDEDSVKDGLQVYLSEGDTTVRLRVTATDGVSTRTYTVIVTRFPATTPVLVSNAGQITASGRLPDIIAQGLRTGPSTPGYRLSSIEVDLDSSSSDRLVRIAPRQTDANRPDLGNDAEIITLSNPDTIVSGYNHYTAPPGTTLKPDTVYYIVLTNSAGTAEPVGNALYTLHADEDTGGAPGWTVENHRLRRTAPTDPWTSIPSTVKIRVNGHTLASRDSTLSEVRVTDAGDSNLALTPTFSPQRTAYNLSVPRQVDEMTFVSVTSHPGASFYYRTPFHYRINDIDSGRDGHQISLALGRNPIQIFVTAENGHDTRVYSLEVTRSAISSDAALSRLELTYDDGGTETAIVLDPSFDADTTSYAASVGNTVDRITVAATRNDDNAVVAYLDADDDPIADADDTEDGHQVALAVGQNTIRVRVTAENGNTTQNYSAVVSRAAASSDAALSRLELTYDDGGTETAISLMPAFHAATYSYSSSVDHSVGEITVVSTPNDDASAVAYLDGSDSAITDADTGTGGHQVPVWVGRNTIRVRVTAQDGNTVRTYSVMASRSDECRRNDGPDTCAGGSHDRPGISIPRCQENGVSIFWHARNGLEAEPPEGWKIERRHWDSGEWVVRTFSFIGEQADALQTKHENYWDWVDTSAVWNVDYTYRVRAINADGSDMDGRVWSRRAPVECWSPNTLVGKQELSSSGQSRALDI